MKSSLKYQNQQRVDNCPALGSAFSPREKSGMIWRPWSGMQYCATLKKRLSLRWSGYIMWEKKQLQFEVASQPFRRRPRKKTRTAFRLSHSRWKVATWLRELVTIDIAYDTRIVNFFRNSRQHSVRNSGVSLHVQRTSTKYSLRLIQIFISLYLEHRQ